METKELTIEEQNKVLAETFVERVKSVCENTTMSHRYEIDYWTNCEELLIIEIKKVNNWFDEYDLDLIKDLEKELKDVHFKWLYRPKYSIIELDIKMYKA